jgi:glutamate N-acetyltransferase/amino-acid N-acetyltransferase
MKRITGNITKPKGFKANGLCCGIKRSGKNDLALIASDVPAVCAAVFTQNSVKAAPLVISQKHAANHQAQAFIINSGNANCFTGQFGSVYAKKTCQVIGGLLDMPQTDVIVASTGIIGKPLPFSKIEAAAPDLVKGLNRTRGGKRAAQGILTTDTCTKEVCVQLPLSGKTVTIGGCAKGSGMIAPNMATMLAFITTDVAITPKMLKTALHKANAESFNCITMDGCMSTNDMVAVMANGTAANRVINAPGKNFDRFCEALRYVCTDLAKKIILDGEGATKFIEINVTEAQTDTQAQKIGLAVANSLLVKTAAFGENANWGRIAAAVGSLGIKKINERNLKIRFSPFTRKNISISVALNIGKGRAKIMTSDISYEYIKINGEYN